MTAKTNQQGAPEALRLADALQAVEEGWSVADKCCAELRRLHAENERLAALVEAQQPAPSAAAAGQHFCPGIPRPGCNYLAQCESVCNKCGMLHSARFLEDSQPVAAVRRWSTYEQAIADPVFQTARSIMGTENIGQDRQLVKAINHVIDSQPSPTPPADSQPGDKDLVAVPRDLIGAACSAIDKKRDGARTLAELRRYTVGDLSAATTSAPQADSVTAPAGGVVGYRISDPSEPDLGHWLSEEPGAAWCLSEPLELATRTQPAHATKAGNQQEARPCHVFTVRKAGGLAEWEPTSMAFALPDGAHALYTLPQPTPPAQAADSVPPMTAADAQRYAEIEADSGASDFAVGIPQAADSVTAPAGGGVAGMSETVQFSDKSKAPPLEKSRRYLKAMGDQRTNSAYFFDDGYPRRESAQDALATLAVLEQLAATTPAQAADSVLEDAARLWEAFIEAWRNEIRVDKIVNIMGGADKLKAVFLDAARKQGGAT